MTGYITKILGIVMIGIFVDIILPNGDTAKYIKGIFAIFIVFVIISPLKQISDNGFNFNNLFNFSTTYINGQLLETINQEKVTQMEKDIVNELTENGFLNASVKIDYNTTNSDINIKNVFVNIENLLLNSTVGHINKYAFIKEVVTKHTHVNERIIIFYE